MSSKNGQPAPGLLHKTLSTVTDSRRPAMTNLPLGQGGGYKEKKMRVADEERGLWKDSPLDKNW